MCKEGCIHKLANLDHGEAAIGRILSPHGLAGFFRVYPYTDYPERCSDLSQVNLELHGQRRRYKVEKASVRGRFWLLKFAGVDNREQAGQLAGGLIIIPKAERVCLPEGSYYFDQIEGLQVYTICGERLGEISEVITTGGHDLYKVKRISVGGTAGKEILLPAVKQFIKQIDLAAGLMIVDLPEGLTEL